MASFVQTLSIFFLLVVFSALQIEATDRLFFNRVTRPNDNYNAEDSKIPLGYQETNPSLDVAAPTIQSQNVAVASPKEPSFTQNRYGEYGLVGSSGDSGSEDKQSNNNNSGDDFIYNMETAEFNGNGNDNARDDVKQQALSATSSLGNGRYTFDSPSESKTKLDTYGSVSRESPVNVGENGRPNGSSLENGQYSSDTAGESQTKSNGSDNARRGSYGNGDDDGESRGVDSLEEYEKYLQRNGYLP